MSKLTQDISRTYENGDNNSVPVLSGAKIYNGALVGLNDAGYGRPFTAGDTPVGFARDHVDNTDGSDGDKTCDIKAVGKVLLTVPGVTVADVGKSVYATDDDTFALNGDDTSIVGKVVRYEDTDTAVVAFDFLNQAATDTEQEPDENDGE